MTQEEYKDNKLIANVVAEYEHLNNYKNNLKEIIDKKDNICKVKILTEKQGILISFKNNNKIENIYLNKVDDLINTILEELIYYVNDKLLVVDEKIKDL